MTRLNNSRYFFIQCIVVLILFFISPFVYAQTSNPVIKSYNSDIILQPNGELNITETINVLVDGNIIKHGIYRDFPTDYALIEGGTEHIDFKLIGTKLDGNNTPNHIAKIKNGLRIYIGDPHVFLKSGWHNFSLNYLVNNVLGFFPNHDELYWNVTGNGWLFPIQETKVNVILPSIVANSVTGITAYTGAYGAKGNTFVYHKMSDSSVRFNTTAPLYPGEGISIVVAWKKGIITPPPLTWRNYLYYLLRYVGNMSNLILFIGTFIIFLYYLFGWFMFGRDPVEGNIFPEFEPPAGFSAAALRYMMDMGYDQKVFVSALVSMAIKGYLTIKQDGEEFTLTRLTLNNSMLSTPEVTIAEHLFTRGNNVKLNQINHSLLNDTIEAFKAELRKEFQSRYFQGNSSYVFRGVVCSNILIFISLWMRHFSFSFNLILAAIFVVVILGAIKKLADTTWRTYIFIIFANFLGIWFFLPMFIGRTAPVDEYDIYYGAILIILALVNIMFFWLLKKRTVQGRKLMDRIAGFKMFLAATEKERVKFINPPTLTPELFDKYLPFAIALNLDENWSKQFETILSNATQAGQEHRPSWYINSNNNNFIYTNFSSHLNSSLISAVNATTASRSGSGFSSGGGFSGGGRGGGGGGGW
jgi:uncharacterized membrane protein YgcG